MKNNLLLVGLLVVGLATLVFAALGPAGGFTVHVPATTPTLVLPTGTQGSIRALTQLTVINLNPGVPCFYSSNPSMTTNGVALFVQGTLTIDVDDNNAYYFWCTNAFDIAGNAWPRR